MSKNRRLKRIAEAVLKHIHANAATYITLTGAIAQKDYSTALACLKVLILRSVTGGIQRKLEQRKKDNDDAQK